MRSVLLAALALVAGCDASPLGSTPRSSTAQLALGGAPSADVLYDLAPLAPGESFAVTFRAAGERLALRSTRTERGYALTLETGGLQPTAAEVRYLNRGREVAPALQLDPNGPLFAGTADEGPDSWHYVWKEGSGWVLVKDYPTDEDGGQAGSTGFTLPDGRTVDVTEVEFRVLEPSAAPPAVVRFESPRGLAITSARLGQRDAVAARR